MKPFKGCMCQRQLLPVITKLVNASLSTGHFPDEWKEAVVKPLLKKGAKDSGHKNLRPVSNLQFVSKITERTVFYQIFSYVTDNGLFPELQSAYRRTHSTETALLKIVNDILLNRQHVSLLVLLALWDLTLFTGRKGEGGKGWWKPRNKLLKNFKTPFIADTLLIGFLPP